MQMTKHRAGLRQAKYQILLGLLATALLAYTLAMGNYNVDWDAKATELFAEGDFTGAVDAANRSLKEDPFNYEATVVRANATRRLRMPRKALADLEAALLDTPDNYRLKSAKAAVLAELKRYDEAIATIDSTTQFLADNRSTILHAVNYRMLEFAQLRDDLLRALEAYHRNRFAAHDILDAFYASTELDSRERSLLIDPLPGLQLQQDIGEMLDRSWILLREAGELLGDVRQDKNASPNAYLSRALIDVNLQRLLRAKVLLQTLLKRGLTPNIRARALTLLADIYERCENYEEQSLILAELVELAGGELEANLTLVADTYESAFRAAEVDPAIRQAFIEKADEHLRTYPTRDLRTHAYRGIAALEWEANADRAADYLEDAFDSLRMQRHSNDRKTRELSRTRRFMLALLDAYNRAERYDLALTVVNTLIGMASQDPFLRERRAFILLQLDQPDEAQKDLLVAMRNSGRRSNLLDSWIEIASHIKDATDQTPQDHARTAVVRWLETRDKLREDLENREADPQFGKRRSIEDQSRFSRALARITSLNKRGANHAINAWHMAEEFGRVGETGESRNYIFRATALEPEILEFRFRLGQYRLDLGRFEAAAHDFESILKRDPRDIESAFNAVVAWQRAGNLERARQVAYRTLRNNPDLSVTRLGAGVFLNEGDIQGALDLIAEAPDAGSTDNQIIKSKVLLEAERFEEAEQIISDVLEQRKETPELLRNLILCQIMLDMDVEFYGSLERFISLPRFLPPADIDLMLDYLESRSQFEKASVLARRVASRFSGGSALALEERAAMNAFRSGDEGPLKELAGRPAVSAALSNDTVRAAFGIVFRDQGPAAAAEYLEHAREFTEEREWAELPIAAAFALTPYQIDLSTFLSRYITAHETIPVPIDDSALYWLCWYRTAKKPEATAEIEPGSEGELLWLRETASSSDPEKMDLIEKYIRFLLFRFAGPGFEDEAQSLASHIIARDQHAVTAARYIAKRVVEEDGIDEAIQFLLPFYQAVPNDYPTFIMLGELMLKSSADHSLLVRLTLRAAERFSDRDYPQILLVKAAIRAGLNEEARQYLQPLLQKDRIDVETLKTFAALAEAAQDAEAEKTIVETVVDRKIMDAELRSFVRNYFRNPNVSLEDDELQILHKFTLDNPTDYDAALTLASQYEDRGLKSELQEMIEAIIPTIVTDESASGASTEILEIGNIAAAQGLIDESLRLIRAGVLANPVDSDLLKSLIELSIQTRGPESVIKDLRLLCFLNPQDPETLFQYGSILLENRTDLADAAIAMIPHLQSISGDDPRYHRIDALNRFRMNDLEGAREALIQALASTPDDHQARYALAILDYILGNNASARTHLETLPDNFEFNAQIQQILLQL